ncbi:MAG TPA: hypothetical protein VGR72_07235 [Candidatus Acidoferrales bacterium]|nr:hypothetical protein [Candidatus Acidoferrales bacterium]
MTGSLYFLTTLGAWRRHATRFAESHFVAVEASASGDENNGTEILALITADEAAHIALERDPEFEALPHPLARTPVSQRVAAALASFAVAPGDDTFTIAEKLACVHPLLRHRAF